ncbi:MAG TPA: hypothetical protein ENJ19_09940 [Gammaproteobacteria bacterium]|nr:hypothetical protein [Gammaproteobacteria bacterium]
MFEIIFAALVTAFTGAPLAVFVRYRTTILANWREPVLRHPVLIVESDDWGAGPSRQAQSLTRIADTLAEFKDCTGHPPVMTLALVLAVADGPEIRRSGDYRRRTLTHPSYETLRQAIAYGVGKGVFALQLHGMEHYWPAALMASDDEEVQKWLRADMPQATESLPSPLQSRWTDASVLPSKDHAPEAVRRAAAEEVKLYNTLFGTLPEVAVPTTFVWNDTVEAAWAEAGVNLVVTPGVRKQCRDAQGRPSCQDKRIHNAERGRGIHYIVRDDYFEPMLGHTADSALAALERKTRCGRPCLLETHRANFIDASYSGEQALQELARLLRLSLQRHPTLRFTSTERLARALIARDEQWVDIRPVRRLQVLALRLDNIPRLGKLARFSGISAVLRATATIINRLKRG